MHRLNHEGAVAMRLAHCEVHKADLAAAPVRIVIAGRLLADAETTTIGSSFQVESGSLAGLQVFHNAHRFKTAPI